MFKCQRWSLYIRILHYPFTTLWLLARLMGLKLQWQTSWYQDMAGQDISTDIIAPFGTNQRRGEKEHSTTGRSIPPQSAIRSHTTAVTTVNDGRSRWASLKSVSFLLSQDWSRYTVPRKLSNTWEFYAPIPPLPLPFLWRKPFVTADSDLALDADLQSNWYAAHSTLFRCCVSAFPGEEW
jgi:hypothetical protein